MILHMAVLAGLTLGSAAAGTRYGAEALNIIGPGSRAQAMGGAYTAAADDATAIHWNPAGLPRIKRNQVYLVHQILFGGLAVYDFAALSVPLPNRAAFALSYTRMGIDDIPEYPELLGTVEERRNDPSLRSNGVPTGYFSDQESMFRFTFAKTFIITYFTEQIELLPEPLQLHTGISMKRFEQILYDFTGGYTGLDLGACLTIGLNYSLFGETPRRDLHIAYSLQNALKTDVVWNTPAESADPVPVIGRFGVSVRESMPRWRSALVVAYQRDAADGDVTDALGAEYTYAGLVSLRGGYRMSEKTWSTGAGLKYKDVRIGYAFYRHRFEPLHSIGIGYDF